MPIVTPGRTWMGRIGYGLDLLEELNRICREQAIRLGRIEGLGAVQRACCGFYDQSRREYGFHTLDRPLEITHLVGNVSLKEGIPFVHAHVTLGDAQGRVFGGHLAPGTCVFAAEVVIQEFEGASLQRVFDQETGLPLWS